MMDFRTEHPFFVLSHISSGSSSRKLRFSPQLMVEGSISASLMFGKLVAKSMRKSREKSDMFIALACSNYLDLTNSEKYKIIGIS